MELEQLNYVNPFGTKTKIRKVIEENTRSGLQMKELLSNNEIETENEWYVLFENGMLIEKGRSRRRSSEYLAGEKHINIKEYYETI
jgi:hypothetical protein